MYMYRQYMYMYYNNTNYCDNPKVEFMHYRMLMVLYYLIIIFDVQWLSVIDQITCVIDWINDRSIDLIVTLFLSFICLSIVTLITSAPVEL